MSLDIRNTVLFTEQNLTAEQKGIARANIGATDEVSAGGGSTDASDLTSGILPAARLATFNTLSPVASAMGALAIDVTKALNTKSISANSTFTFSATPSAGTRFGLRLTADATARTVTIPSSYSTQQNAAITSFVIPASATVYLAWEYTGSAYNLVGDPISAAQNWVAGNVTTNAISASDIDWSLSPSHSKTLAANTTFTFSNATDGQTINVAVTNTASNYTVTWPTVKWAGGAAPTQTVGAKTDVYTFTKVGSVIYGNVSANHS